MTGHQVQGVTVTVTFCHSRKSAGVTINFNNSSVPLQSVTHKLEGLHFMLASGLLLRSLAFAAMTLLCLFGFTFALPYSLGFDAISAGDHKATIQNVPYTHPPNDLIYSFCIVLSH